MTFLADLFHNTIFLSAVTGWLVAQVMKTVIHLILTKEFVAERMVGSGGMPSSHSATVCGLATAAGITYGGGSFEFAISVILAIIVMYDAMCVADREPEITRKECDELMKHYFGIWTFVIYVKKYTDKIVELFEKK